MELGGEKENGAYAGDKNKTCVAHDVTGLSTLIGWRLLLASLLPTSINFIGSHRPGPCSFL
jgi:hypothetical protein